MICLVILEHKARATGLAQGWWSHACLILQLRSSSSHPWSSPCLDLNLWAVQGIWVLICWVTIRPALSSSPAVTEELLQYSRRPLTSPKSPKKPYLCDILDQLCLASPARRGWRKPVGLWANVGAVKCHRWPLHCPPTPHKCAVHLTLRWKMWKR